MSAVHQPLEHMDLVRQRHAEHASPEGQAAMRARIKQASARYNGAAMKSAAESATRAQSRVAKVQWLRVLSDEFSRAVAPVTPCAKGCNHCCRMSVVISSDEAEVIGREIGIKPATPPKTRSQDQADLALRLQRGQATSEQLMAEMHALRDMVTSHFKGVPCTFLDQITGACSIYSTRPIACRTHFSADRDALLCHLVEGQAVEVPTFSARAIHELCADTLSPLVCLIADLRDFFPTGRQR